VNPGLLSLLSIGTRASRDIALWDVKRGQLEFSLNVGHSVDFAVVSTASKTVVCGAADSGVVMAISLTSGAVDHMSTLEDYLGMTDLTISVDSVFIATPASGVVVLSMTQRVVTGSLRDPHGPSVPTKLLVNSQNDRHLIVGYKHGLVHIFDVDMETVVCSMCGHTARINSLHLLPSGQLISAGDDQYGIIWNHQLYMDQESDFAEESELRDPETDEVNCSASESEVNYSANCYVVDSTQHLLYAGLSCCGLVLTWNIETGQFYVTFSHSSCCDSSHDVNCTFSELIH